MGCQQPKAVNKGWRDLMSEPCGDDSVVGPRSLPAFLSLGSVPNPCCQHRPPDLPVGAAAGAIVELWAWRLCNLLPGLIPFQEGRSSY